jgi:hypothetical protein
MAFGARQSFATCQLARLCEIFFRPEDYPEVRRGGCHSPPVVFSFAGRPSPRLDLHRVQPQDDLPRSFAFSRAFARASRAFSSSSFFSSSFFALAAARSASFSSGVILFCTRKTSPIETK